MHKKKKLSHSLTVIPIIIIIALFIWLFTVIFEGEKPLATLSPQPEFLSQSQLFLIKISDMKRGLKVLRISYSQGGRDTNLFEKKFPFKGLFNKEGVSSFEHELEIDPAKLHLAQGRVDLNIRVWDYSRRGGGDGNLTLVQHKMTVDTIPPSIRAISRMHNINKGGAGLVIYRTTSDTKDSGVYVDDNFFPGFPAGAKTSDEIHLAYFAVPCESSLDPSIYLWARDRAENTAKGTFYYHVRKKSFDSEPINITDKLLERLLPYFSYYDFDPENTDLEKYLKINIGMREENDNLIYEMMKKSSPEKLWVGAWLRLPNAATITTFAKHRIYYYNGEKIDEKDHMGMDLASLANSPVIAANNGKVLFAEKRGIYGLSILLDHGQNLGSLYGHLSSINVSVGQDVKKGDIMGYTGHTGLALGYHLHFSVLVNGVYVNPIEWWDDHWIQDNVDLKLKLVNE